MPGSKGSHGHIMFRNVSLKQNKQMVVLSVNHHQLQATANLVDKGLCKSTLDLLFLLALITSTGNVSEIPCWKRPSLESG